MKTALPLRQLVQGIRPLRVWGRLDAPVVGLACEARHVEPGSVFFAVPDACGRRAPEAIPDAIERGAAAIVCEQGGGLPYYRTPCLRVADCRRALAQAAARYFGEPSRRLQVVGVTGCASRVSVAHLLAAVLRAAGIATGLVTSRACQLGLRMLGPWAEPIEPLEVQERLAAMERAGCRAAVLELPPEAVARGSLAATELDTLLVTHLSAAAEGDTPAAAFRPGFNGEAGWQFRKGGGGWWHVEGALAGRAAPGAGPSLRMRYGTGRGGLFRVLRARSELTGSRLQLAGSDGVCREVHLPLPGREAARAAVAVVAAAHGWKLPEAAVLQGLAHAPPVPGRLEPVRGAFGFQVLVDATPTLADFEATLRELRELTPGRLRVLVGCGARHPAAVRPRFGEVAGHWADEVVVTDDNPEHEPPRLLAAAVVAGCARVCGRPPPYVPDRREAIAAVLARAQPGDCVLLAGKGHHGVQAMGGCVAPFDDREHAAALLGQRASRPRPQNAPAGR